MRSVHVSSAASAATTILITAVLGVVGCSGNRGDAPQDLSLAVDWLDFGTVAEGEALYETVEIRNDGDADLHFTTPPELVIESGTDTAFELQAPLQVIEARDTAEMYLTFHHSPELISYGHIEFLTDDPDEPEQMMVISGESFIPILAASIEPGMLEFGYVPSGGFAEEVVQVRNAGTLDIEWLSATVSGGDGEFYVATTSQGPIAPGEAGSVTVGFSPGDGSHETAALNIDMGDGLTTLSYTVTLNGNAPGSAGDTAPEVSITAPTELMVLSADVDLTIVADVVDQEQPDDALYCTLESTLMGAVEQDVTDPESHQLTMVVDVYNEDLADLQMIDYPGVHTLTLCCFDEMGAYACDALVASVLEEFSADDGDGDGYDAAQGDCDDADPAIYPGAPEHVDGVDEDCDGDVDNGTEVWDDDGDGLSEEDGDCDDGDPAIGPDAEETADFVDNDCDGVIDEGTTNADDDGDGLAEATGDCNDDDAAVYANAPEWCDAVDNDCDGTVDEDCFEGTPPLAVIGGIVADKLVVPKTGEASLSVTVIAGDEADLRFDWQADGGSFSAEGGDTTTSARVTWTAPDEAGARLVWVVVTDLATNGDDGEPLSDEAYLGIEVSTSDPSASAQGAPGGCSMAAAPGAARGGLATMWTALLALVLAWKPVRGRVHR